MILRYEQYKAHKYHLFLQVCRIVLGVEKADEQKVTLKPGTAALTREGGRELSIYFIVDNSPAIKPKENEMHLEIVFKRRLTNEAVMVFLPSLMLITISYFTSFFKQPNFFNTAITVNLSVMLTLTTLLISVVKKLAQTSYIKWIEYWLIFAQLIPFTQVILITCLEASKERTDEKKESRRQEFMENNKERFHVSIGGRQVKVRVKLCHNDLRSVLLRMFHPQQLRRSFWILPIP